MWHGYVIIKCMLKFIFTHNPVLHGFYGAFQMLHAHFCLMLLLKIYLIQALWQLKAQGSWFSLHNRYYQPTKRHHSQLFTTGSTYKTHSVNKEYSMCRDQYIHKIMFDWEDNIELSSCGLADHTKTIQKYFPQNHVNSGITIFHWLY